MGGNADYPITQAIADTSHALASELGLDPTTVKRFLSAWVLRKIPKEEREDVLQGLACRVLGVRPHTPGLLYRVVKFYIADWWKARRYRQHASLDTPLEDDDGGLTPLVETIPDGSRPVEESACAVIWAREVLSLVPSQVVQIGKKRADGTTLNDAERQRLSRWKRGHSHLWSSEED